MKTTIKLVSYFVVTLLMGLTFNSCEGEAGPAGADGADGADGNANVIYSDWITPTWEEFNEFGIFTQKADFTVSELTQDVVDNGVVMVYWKNWQDIVRPLPFEFTDMNWLVQFKYKLNNIQVIVVDQDDLNSYPDTPANSNVIRYIIIPGGTSVTGRSSLTPNQQVFAELENAGVDVNDYYAVCAYYGINPE